MFTNIQIAIENAINYKLSESTDSFLSDIYDNLTADEQININKKNYTSSVKIILSKY